MHARLLLLFCVTVIGLFGCTPDHSLAQTFPTIAPLAPTIPPPTPSPTIPSATHTPSPPPPTVTITPSPTSKPTATPFSLTYCAGSSGSIVSDYFPSPLSGAAQFYQIYLPPCYENDRTYPTIYLIHGNNQNSYLWQRIGLINHLNQAIASKKIPPILVVMPTNSWLADYSSGGAGSYESVIIDELIPHIESEFCAWPHPLGRAIGGISRGGYWSLEIGFRNPTQFLSVAGHSPSLLDQSGGPTINPQYTGSTLAVKQLRIYLDIGDQDGALINTLKLHEDMAEAKVKHWWTLNLGGHNETYWAAHIPEYILWYTQAWPKNRRQYPNC